jgi:hypothetical protein
MQDLLNQITPVLVTTLMAILVAFIGYIGKVVIKLVPLLLDAIVAKVGLTKYQQTKLFATDIWNIVEENYRLHELIGSTVQAKIIMFESLIKKKIPGITDKEINTLRQAIAGEFNKSKKIIN